MWSEHTTWNQLKLRGGKNANHPPSDVSSCVDAGAQLGEGDPLCSTFPLLFSEQLLTRNSCQVLNKNKNASCVETKPGFAGSLCVCWLWSTLVGASTALTSYVPGRKYECCLSRPFHRRTSSEKWERAFISCITCVRMTKNREAEAHLYGHRQP